MFLVFSKMMIKIEQHFNFFRIQHFLFFDLEQGSPTFWKYHRPKLEIKFNMLIFPSVRIPSIAKKSIDLFFSFWIVSKIHF